MIFPEFENINVIDEIREKRENLYAAYDNR